MEIKDSHAYFWYRPLNRKNIEKLYEMLKYDDDVEISVSIKRKFKKNSTISEQICSFNTLEEFCKYVDDNGIRNLKDIDFYVSKNKVNGISLRYECYFWPKWCLYYREDNTSTDAVIFRLKNFFKFNLYYLYKSASPILLWIYSYALTLYKVKYYYIILIIWLVMLSDLIFNRKYPYKENAFLQRNKDSIILSIIFYILGVLTPILIEFITKS